MIVTMLTDFGTNDPYVGVMKGVVLSRAPAARVVDLTHEVAPQAIVRAAFLFETAWQFFPAGTVHVVVVDPGVGTRRRRLALAASGHFFVGPDNGVLSAALSDASRGIRHVREEYEARRVRLPEDIFAVAIEDPSNFMQPPSATFEGRDVFAPVAAFLVSGGAMAELGPAVNQILAFPAFRAPSDEGRIEGFVLHTDRFGNLMTDIVVDSVPEGAEFVLAGRRMPLSHAYGEAQGPAAIPGSNGRIEIAMPNGNAALVLGAGPGDSVIVSLPGH
jgi:S-adenosylmethionine hydrolase